MNDVMQLLITFVNPIILIMALVLMMSMFARSGQSRLGEDYVVGGMFALALLYSMSDPIILNTGGIFDMRGLLIGTATALMGPKVGLITLVTGLAMRWSIGNPGMIAGFTSMAIAFTAGLVWRTFVRPRLVKYWQKALTLALMISLQNLAIFVADQQHWYVLFLGLGTYTVVCNLIGTFLITYLTQKEMRFLKVTKGLEIAATTDHLTGLLNRRTLESQFPDLTKTTKTYHGITALYFDIDKFKAINDTHGHAAGDSVLKAVTNRLSTAFRAEDAFSRIGGDEFVVVMPNLSAQEAETVAERCRKLISDIPVVHENDRIPVSISIGAVWARKSPPLDRLLQLADQELYKAKNMGRNIVSFKARPMFEGHPSVINPHAA